MWRWILAALLAVSPIAAQTSAGRVTGVVVDSSGAVIPNARVTAQNTETGVDTPSRSNAEGAYVLYPLPAGTYAITAEAAGFRGERIENLQVDVAAVLSRDIGLELAATKQEPVVVSAATAPLVTESPAVESTINWTWAKGLDSVSNALNVAALDVENLGRDRADSDYVRRHTMHVNGMWEIPVGRGHALLSHAPRWLDSAARGWRLSGIWTYYTGRRFTPTINNTGLTNNRPEVVYGAQANLPPDQRSTARWFNYLAFGPPPSICGPSHNGLCFGNAGRNILVGPGINVADAGLAKSFPIVGERARVTFRLELFNAFNHPNYALPNANVSDGATAGTINSLIKDMREAQFALRFDF